MTKLIINADDLGITTQRSHGIFLCFERGAISSATVIPNCSDSDRAIRIAKERDLPVGLHLNLTEGSPLSKASDISSLLTTDGFFLGRESLQRSLREEIVDMRHVEREVRSQLEWFLENYGQPTHVDGHHHVHVDEKLSSIIATVLDQYGVSFVRIPEEPTPPFGYEVESEKLKYIEELSGRAKKARTLYLAHGIRSSDHFRGLCLSGQASNRNLRHTLGRLLEGTTELMVHPGSPSTNPDPFESHPQRVTELQMLTADFVVEELKERKIELISYRDLF